MPGRLAKSGGRFVRGDAVDGRPLHGMGFGALLYAIILDDSLNRSRISADVHTHHLDQQAHSVGCSNRRPRAGVPGCSGESPSSCQYHEPHVCVRLGRGVAMVRVGTLRATWHTPSESTVLIPDLSIYMSICYALFYGLQMGFSTRAPMLYDGARPSPFEARLRFSDNTVVSRRVP
ncbi:hypothetical protein PENSPDRAFT_302604 [Peniophora sp. CONT]|nr:hypothetical protein PENSPDRAFT_302604 [Peniophora sp. CONT]